MRELSPSSSITPSSSRVSSSHQSHSRSSSFPGLDGLRSGFEKIVGLFSDSARVSKASSAFYADSVTAFGIITAKAVAVDPRWWRAAFKPTFGVETNRWSIQTILASPRERRLTRCKRVSERSEQSADKTIYSFRHMTKNIGLFTNALGS